MGQQQLLLLVFGLIVTAVAILAALTAIPEKIRQSEAENLVSRNLDIATAAVAWKTVRDPYNGGNTFKMRNSLKHSGLLTAMPYTQHSRFRPLAPPMTTKTAALLKTRSKS